MKLTIINQFAAYLQSQNYADQTIRCYVGTLCLLSLKTVSSGWCPPCRQMRRVT